LEVTVDPGRRTPPRVPPGAYPRVFPWGGGQRSLIHCVGELVNHVPSTYVNVVFHSLPEADLYTDGKPAAPLIVNGWTRTGHPEAQTDQLVREIADAATRVTGIPAERVLVIIGNSPAQFAVEGGRVLPEPGQEEAWLRAGLRQDPRGASD